MAKPFFKTLAQDLLNLKINTIVKPEMSAVKMPSLRRQALYEVARDYSLKLQELGVRSPALWRFAGMASFRELCERAKRGIERFEGDPKIASPDRQLSIQRNIKMLERIQYQSLQIVHMFEVLEKGAKEWGG